MRYVPKYDPEEDKRRAENLQLEKTRQAKKKKKMLAITGLVLLVLATTTTYAAVKPGRYDDFAKCLTEKGAKMYGEDWCPYTKAQKNMFGKSFKYIDYEVKKDLKLRPTWIINGDTYETVQSFERLASLTGCEY